ncbi:MULTISPECIES: hypothetical protein [unclassified Ruegeria]|uniref:hypothetical protein n=1 Tax=unclassified Ruegeria TaxID=2625375 RepID=UPI0014913562|nr:MULTISPECIES: hypothetical protein [unclassified Ruegeria]NOD87412.1 hypothetical protein [Ruegeria sp. HKCCD4318]NOE12967.1 hypothetical protein [Ruegeria sp. HKCCD4318-2]NOG08866.1 hypothetical protein [Ruegeria sp. HKCCD4315]
MNAELAEFLRETKVTAMIPLARRCIARHTGQPTTYTRSDNCHEITSGGGYLRVAPDSKSSKHILQQWTEANG